MQVESKTNKALINTCVKQLERAVSMSDKERLAAFGTEGLHLIIGRLKQEIESLPE